MKKMFVMLMVLLLIFSTFALANEKSEAKTFEGYTYNKVINKDGNKLFTKLEKNKDIKDINLIYGCDNISGDFKILNDLVTVNANLLKFDKINNIIYYNGTAKYKNEMYNVDFIKNDYGLSGLIYNKDKSEVIPLIMSSLDKDEMDSILFTINNEFKKNANLISEETVIKKDINDLVIDSKSTPINKTEYLFYDGTCIPFVVSAGSVEGTLYYQTNIDVGNQFYADRIYGVINWVSGFDGLSITNTNEEYGHLYGTPSCPPRQMTTWDIDKFAEQEGQYYYKATVSYTLIVKNLPVLFWRSKDVTLP